MFSAALPAVVFFVAKLGSFLAAFAEPLAAVLGTEINHIRKKYLASLTGPIPVDFVIGICVQRRKKHGRRREHAKRTLFMRVVCGTVRAACRDTFPSKRGAAQTKETWRSVPDRSGSVCVGACFGKETDQGQRARRQGGCVSRVVERFR